MNDYLIKKKSHVVYISRLDDDWLKNNEEPSLDKIRFLYVGRMSPEKGIFDFIKMFNNLKLEAEFSIVGNSENQTVSNNKIKFLGYVADPQKLINIFDKHNITILPSYSEATPYVVDESLSRKRPVIIFEDINYIVRNKKGIFISKRDLNSLKETAEYIMKNYKEIQKKMEENSLPTKKSMIKQISDIINFKNHKL